MPMSDPPERKVDNPFAFSPQDAADFMQRLWNPLGVPMPGFATPAAPAVPGMQNALPFPNPAAMFAAIDPAEIDRKIDELRVVESWLTMTLAMMQMSIKTLELQKAALVAMQPARRDSAPATKK
jgi:hypothetical protein